MNKLKIAHHFKAILLADDFIITGTLALSQMGFTTTVKDLDIILINPKQHTLEVLENLEKTNPPKNLVSYPTSIENKRIFRFVYEGVNIDVFIHPSSISSAIQTKCGLNITPLYHIVSAKKYLARPKDIIQLLKLSNEIITDDEFKNYVKTF